MCENWLSSVCGANSNYSGMCYEAIKEWHSQFGETGTTPQQSYSPRSEAFLTPSQSLWSLKDPAGRVQTSYQQSPAPTVSTPSSSRESDISRAEVLKMMAVFQKKQDAMTTRINDLEQEKSRTSSQINKLEQESNKNYNYVKTVEGRIKQIDNVTTILQKQQNTRVVQLKTISSSIYILSQKLDELLTQQSVSKKDSMIHLKTLEVEIGKIEENAKKIQKQLDTNIPALTKKVNDMKARYEFDKKIVICSIDTLTKKFDNVIKKQNKSEQDKSSTSRSLEVRIEQIEKDLSDLTIHIRNLAKRKKESKIEWVENELTPKKSAETILIQNVNTP